MAGSECGAPSNYSMGIWVDHFNCLAGPMVLFLAQSLSVVFVCMACVIGIDVKSPNSAKEHCVNTFISNTWAAHEREKKKLSYESEKKAARDKKRESEREIERREKKRSAHTLQSAWSAKIFVWCFLRFCARCGVHSAFVVVFIWALPYHH